MVKMNKKGYIMKAAGFILSLTIGQAIVVFAIIYIVYHIGKFGLLG